MQSYGEKCWLKKKRKEPKTKRRFKQMISHSSDIPLFNKADDVLQEYKAFRE